MANDRYLSGLEGSSAFTRAAEMGTKPEKKEDPYVFDMSLPATDAEIASSLGVNLVKGRSGTGGFDIEAFKPKVYDIETKGGTISDRPGSQYSGIAQLGQNERNPILKQLGITDAQYKSDVGLQKQVADVWFNSLATRLEKNGFEVNDLNMWTAHNQGVGGLNQILKGEVSSGVMSNIRNQAGMDENSSVQDYLNYYGSKFR